MSEVLLSDVADVGCYFFKFSVYFPSSNDVGIQHNNRNAQDFTQVLDHAYEIGVIGNQCRLLKISPHRTCGEMSGQVYIGLLFFDV